MTKKKKAERGRPELPETSRKSLILQFRCTSHEKKQIENHAAQHGLSVSNWIRNVVLESVESNKEASK